MRANTRKAICNTDFCDMLDDFTQRVKGSSERMLIRKEVPLDRYNIVSRQVAYQMTPALRAGNSVTSFPFFGAMLVKLFG